MAQLMVCPQKYSNESEKFGDESVVDHENIYILFLLSSYY